MPVRPPQTTDEDIARIVASVRRQVFRETMEIAERAGAIAEACIRFGPVALYCRHARAERGESVKDVAGALKIPQYVVNKIEDGDVFDVDLAVLRRYVIHLGIDDWFAHWEASNAALATLLAQPRRVREGLAQAELLRQAALAVEAADGNREQPAPAEPRPPRLRVVKSTGNKGGSEPR